MKVTVTTKATKAHRATESTEERAARIRGIVNAAERLGVTRQHLYYVVRGKRHSPGLLRRYHQLNFHP